jgi:hypothetical protein
LNQFEKVVVGESARVPGSGVTKVRDDDKRSRNPVEDCSQRTDRVPDTLRNVNNERQAAAGDANTELKVVPEHSIGDAHASYLRCLGTLVHRARPSGVSWIDEDYRTEAIAMSSRYGSQIPIVKFP